MGTLEHLGSAPLMFGTFDQSLIGLGNTVVRIGQLTGLFLYLGAAPIGAHAILVRTLCAVAGLRFCLFRDSKSPWGQWLLETYHRIALGTF